MAKWHYEAKWSILNGVLTISENSHIVRVTMACCDHGCTEFHLGNIGGYVIWWLIVLGRGQTPGKQLLGIRAIREDGQPATWGRMFLREFVYKNIVFGILSVLTAGIVWVLDYLWALWDRDRQTLHDKLSGTVVVQGPG